MASPLSHASKSATKGAGTPKYAEHSAKATAEQLLMATATLLAESKDLDVSLSDIATRSGFNAALIKYYFGNKEGLLMRLLERDSTLVMSGLRQLLTTRASAVQKLRWHIRGIINSYYKMPYLNRLIHHMLHQASRENAERVQQLFITPMIAAYRQILAQGTAEHSLKPMDPVLLYYGLVGACEHIFYAGATRTLLLGEAHISAETKEAYITLVEEMCLNGLAERR